jgi:hypothetical protein
MADRPDAGAPGNLEFRFDFALPERLAGWFFGITPGRSRLVLKGDRLVVDFGPWRVDTPLANVAGAERTGPYGWPRIIGPAHLSLKDRGLTFASTDRSGVCIRFRRPVPGLEPLGILRHPGLTVTVEDAPALVEVLSHAARRYEEESARARRHPDRPVISRDDDGRVEVDEVMGDVVDDLQGLTAHELRDRAKTLGIKGVGSKKKSELIDLLSHHHAS